ncbi:ribosomal RNA small subunit methyltransferase NEP1-like [Babylonia areolata]|uniref:ribosomal RNA small subunit methyltransferase NEP1-like n=1 Tax=Babylonia areolata TaxID=304850 RepID=UPI003FD238ED
MAAAAKKNQKRLIVILENATLETVKMGKVFELLNCDRHKNLGRKAKRDITQCRPDITHQCLLMLMDSPLNRAGLLQVYIRTEKNVLIEINPQTRIPRTFERFCGLMVQLLHKFAIKGTDNTKLLKVIKNPVTQHLPAGVKKIVMSFKASEVVDPKTLIPADEPVTLVVGAMAHGSVEVDYSEAEYSISNYPLSAALTCAKLCDAAEAVWGVQ